MRKILNITFLVLVAIWLFGTYKFSNTKNQQAVTVSTNSESIATTTPTEAVETTTATSTTVATTTPAKPKPAEKTEVVAKTPVISPPPAETPANTTPSQPAPDFAAINTTARTALVNIFCTVNGDQLSPISGTGVIISPDGIILTNAHVAQYFLLQNLYRPNYIQCIIRTGSPAYPTYHAELAYISPTWVAANKDLLKESDEIGTGEDDFGFLHITDRIDGSPLPAALPYIPVNTEEDPKVGSPVVLISYPAGFLGGLTILQNLNVTSAVTTIQNVFTFKANTIDVLDVGGTVVSQNGASGGAVVDGTGSTIGVISTRSDGDTTGSRDLNAITLGYINRELQNETGLSLHAFLSQDISDFAKRFQLDTAPFLAKMISDELTKN